MTDFLLLDKNGTLPANKITENILVGEFGKTFPLDRGSFFTDTVKVYNRATNTLLKRKIDYDLVETDDEAVRETSKSVAKYLTILRSVHIDIQVEYQAVGGIYQFRNGRRLADAVNEFISLPDNTRVIGVPDQWESDEHIQHINDFFKLGPLNDSLNRIEDAIRAGGSKKLIDAMLAYTDALAINLATELDAQVDAFNRDIAILKNRTTFRDGRYYLTDINDNPSQVKGGNWSLETNTLLYGAVDASDVGDFVDVGSDVGRVAALTNFWRKNDGGSGATYALTASATAITEGESVNITLNTNLPQGTQVPYRITGVQAADITVPLTGNFVVGPGGLALLVITTVADRLTETDEVLRLTLVQAPTNYVNVLVNDTSKTPYYAVKFTTDIDGYVPISEASEGTSLYLHIEGTELQEGERLYLRTEGSSISPSDFDTTLPAYLDISGGRATTLITIKEDRVTEGTEYLVISLSPTNNVNNIVASSTLRINDTSLGAVYRSKFVVNADGTGQSITQANEGTNLYLVIDGDWLIDGTVANLTYGGAAGPTDFNGTRPTTATIADGKAILQYSLKNDQATEGSEVFTVFVNVGGNTVTTASVTILDTSITQGYDMYFSSNSTGSDRISQVSEGGSCFLILKTVGVPNGTNYTLSYTGSASPNDFVNTRPGSLVVNNDFAYVQYQIKPDRITEGDEAFVVTIGNIPTASPSASITILDTSQNPTASAFWSNNEQGTDPITQSNEGRTIWLIINTVNILDGETINIVRSGTVNNDDFTWIGSNTPTVQNNRAVMGFTIKADQLTEAYEELWVTAKTMAGADLVTTNIGILDTSQTPLPTYQVTTNTTSVNEGGGVVFTFQTTNVPAGTSFNWALNGGSSSADHVPSLRAGSFTVGADGRATYSVTIVEDWSLNEGNETLFMTVFKATDGTLVATSPTVTIQDTSVKTVLNITYSDSFHLIDTGIPWSNVDPDSGETIYMSESLSTITSAMGYTDLNRYYQINLTIPSGMKIGGSNTVYGVYYNYQWIKKGAGIHIGPEFNNIDVNIYVDGWVFGTGGTRTPPTVGEDNFGPNGGAGIMNESTRPVRVYIGSTGWLCGGGGAGEGRVNSNNAYAGGGAPYGKGWNGGGAAKLTTGGPQNNAIGNDGGNVGVRGDGDNGGNPGPNTVGNVIVTNASGGKVGP